MPDWDEDSPELRDNLRRVIHQIRNDAESRAPLNLDTLRIWHRETMKGLKPPNRAWVGRLRGEAGLEQVQVQVGKFPGVSASEVADETKAFERRLSRIIQRLDEAIATEADLNADQLDSVLQVCAWTHAEWVRIHPFANGNGRTARLLANAIALRYGLPPFVCLRPRPNHGYPNAAEAAMRGDFKPLALAFRSMLDACLSDEIR